MLGRELKSGASVAAEQLIMRATRQESRKMAVHIDHGTGHFVQPVNWFSSIENTPVSLTSTFFTTQVRPVLSVSLAS